MEFNNLIEPGAPTGQTGENGSLPVNAVNKQASAATSLPNRIGPDPQAPAVVSGIGAIAESNVAGLPRSSSSDRESAGVASQASTTLASTEGTRTVAPQAASVLSTFSTVKALGKQLLAQDAAFKSLLAKSGLLECVLEKSRSESIKNAGQGLLSALQVFRESREQVTRSFNVVVDVVKREEAAKTTLQAKQATDKPTTRDTETQSPCWWDATPPTHNEQSPAPIAAVFSSISKARNPPSPQTTTAHAKEQPPQVKQSQDWTKVVGKRRRNKATKKLPPPEKDTTKPPKPPPVNATKPKRPPPDSISVKPENGETYSDILKAIRQKVDINAIGSQVSKISESRNGEIIIRLNHQDKKREELVDALKSNLGDRAAVRSLISYDDVDIQDLDNITTASEVESSIISALGSPANEVSIKVKSIRPAYAGTQRATVRLKSAEAIKLAKMGRIYIGWIKARVRLKATTTRCFRCLGYGHTTHACKGTDRSKACSLCCSANHRASACTSPPKCAACMDAGEPTDHYPGSSKCTAHRKALSKNKTPSNEQREPGIEPVPQIIRLDA